MSPKKVLISYRLTELYDWCKQFSAGKIKYERIYRIINIITYPHNSMLWSPSVVLFQAIPIQKSIKFIHLGANTCRHINLTYKFQHFLDEKWTKWNRKWFWSTMTIDRPLVYVKVGHWKIFKYWMYILPQSLLGKSRLFTLRFVQMFRFNSVTSHTFTHCVTIVWKQNQHFWIQ